MSVRAFFEFLRHWRVWLQTAFMLGVVGIYLWLVHNNATVLHDLENSLLNWRVLLSGERPPPKDIVILGIETTSFPSEPWTPEQIARTPELGYMTNSWPWNRTVWALLTDRLFAAGAREVVFDLTFRDPNPGDAAAGAAFARHAGHLVITSTMDYQQADIGASASQSEHENYVILNDPVDDLIPETGPEIVGLANVIKDEDGLYRRVSHAYNLKLQMHPEYANIAKFMASLQADGYSLSWLAAQKALGHDPALSPWEPMAINYYGSARSLDTKPIESVLVNWDSAFAHGDFFKDKYVFIGMLDQTRGKDYFETAWGLTSGTEIQATAFANLVYGEWLRPAPAWVSPALAVAFGLLSLLVSLRIHSIFAKLGLFLWLGLVYLFGSQWLFSAHFLMVPVSGAFVGLVGCGGFGTIYDFVLERYERRRVLGMFENMVSPGVANLVLSNRGDFEQRLGGQRKDVVILFSDIRGFTTWSEKVGPDALVAQLNEYFYGMVEVIQQEGGTVQKYIGDALMAAWGDVYERPLKDCAIESVRASLRMRESLEKLNADWVGKDKREQLAIGVGINLGEGVVGRIGHPRRQEFTVMGDAVNLADRLESATKQYRQTILVGQQIQELASGHFDFRLVDKMQVKGKTFAVPVYVPIGPKGAAPPPGLTEYNAAIEKYYAREFEDAVELFHAANEKMGGEDFLCENFKERCGHFIASPPPADWDGGWTLKEK